MPARLNLPRTTREPEPGPDATISQASPVQFRPLASSRIAAEQQLPPKTHSFRARRHLQYRYDGPFARDRDRTQSSHGSPWRHPFRRHDDFDFVDLYGSPDSQSEYDDNNDAEPAASDSDDNVELTDINPGGHALPPRPSAPSKKGGCRAQPPIAQPARVLRPVPDRRSRAAAVAAARSQRQGS